MLDGRSFAVLSALRERHFPPARNQVPAHLTLFHALPGAEIAAVCRELDRVARQQRPIRLGPARPRSLGRGTALAFASAELERMRREFAREWASWLTPQDAAPGFQPHVTIQNKVAPPEASALLTALQAEPVLLEPIGEGLQLWHYRRGPWESAKRFRFAG